MDSSRFDHFARVIARRTSRRSFVAGLAAVLTGLVEVRGTAAACPAEQIAAAGGRCVCRTTGRAPGPEGFCPCPSGLIRCGDTCVNLSTDPAHCGSCGNLCPAPSPGSCQNERICVQGTCAITPLPAGTICRPAATTCDAAEVCDGQRLDCPPDLLAPAGTLCRPAAGACDVAEYCTGSSVECPPDQYKAAGTLCRAGNGPCDPEERCTGDSPACPADETVIGGEFCLDVCCAAPERCLIPLPGGEQPFCGIGGGDGQACFVDGASCNPGLSCALNITQFTGVCRPCGDVGEISCIQMGSMDFTCNGDNVTCDIDVADPYSSVCRSCGRDGEICCGTLFDQDWSCDPELHCVVSIDTGNPSNPFSTVCRACGGENEPCCGAQSGGSGEPCDSGLVCVPELPGGTMLGYCRACGGVGEACCVSIGSGTPVVSCDPGLACAFVSGSEGVCRECGGRDEICCGSALDPTSLTCDPGLTCSTISTAFDGIACLAPEDCGSAGQPCCGIAQACDTDLECRQEADNRLICR